MLFDETPRPYGEEIYAEPEKSGVGPELREQLVLLREKQAGIVTALRNLEIPDSTRVVIPGGSLEEVQKQNAYDAEKRDAAVTEAREQLDALKKLIHAYEKVLDVLADARQ